ncbi:hypothetical protein JNJ66_02080 [Candidatus Saccharibacteria bacterium]|nr:hypothetical protein [Candidatus Saccharibacteria bacterium]
MPFTRATAVSLLTGLMLVLSNLLLASPASAMASVKSVHTPKLEGDSVVAWADFERDCSDTAGCWNYLKIERKESWPRQWSHAAGGWANQDGWNSVSAVLLKPGECDHFRATAQSYNDLIVKNESSSGGSSTSSTVVQKTPSEPWSSAEAYLCRPALA